MVPTNLHTLIAPPYVLGDPLRIARLPWTPGVPGDTSPIRQPRPLVATIIDVTTTVISTNLEKVFSETT